MFFLFSGLGEEPVRAVSMENFSSAGIDRLFRITQRGNVGELHQLLAENPVILHNLPLMCSENPLHFSSAAGHLDFAREILKLNPEFARELNPEGYSPMHLASANGHIDIEREIIRIDPKLCRVEGREKRTPLHFAVLKGRVDVLSEMLASCEGCIEDVTVQNETALHLAVKHCQFGCFQIMLDWTRQMGKEDILNNKDEHGNTILHVATWKKQRQVLELLLGYGPGTMEVNAINKSGLTALDLLLIFPSEAGDREIQDILKSAGALQAQDLSLNMTACSSSAHDPTVNNLPGDLVKFFKFHKGRDSPSDVRTTLLVIAVLVATATYQVGISPPGGLWQDDDKGHIAGISIMGTHSSGSFIALIALNSIGLFVSLYMIATLTSKFPLQAELQICLGALYATYNIAIIAVSPSSTNLFTIVFTSILPSTIPLCAKLLRRFRVDKVVVGMFHPEVETRC